MAGKVYEIGFKIAGDLSGNFQKSFKTANAAVQNFNKGLNLVNKSAADVSAMIKQKKAVAEAARNYIQAKQKVAELGRAISATKNPSSQMVAEFNRAKAALSKTKSALESNRNSLRALERQTGLAGLSIKELTARENALARAADRARIAQQRQQKTIAGIKGAASGVQANAGYAAASSAAVGAGLLGSVKSAMDFEDQRAELRKFSDDYETIFANINTLTTKYAKSSEDMVNMATAAMQAGIASTSEDITKIIEAQTQAAVAFSMEGEAVGTAWADIQSKMGLTVDKTKDVFDIINKLGNETSASSEDIINVLQRQGGTLKGLTALSAEQIAALAGAFRSAAPSAEVAATSMGTFIGRLTNGEAATGAQTAALEKLGLDGVELAKQLTGSSDSAQAAIQGVLAQINKLPEHEKGAVIGQLFGTEAGIKSAVATLASQSQMLGGNFEAVSDKANYAGSMFAEYSSRADTTSNSLEILQNITKQLSGQIGNFFLPYVRKAAETITQLAPKISEWMNANKGLIRTISFIGAGIAGLAAAAVPLFIAFKTAMFYINMLKVGFGVLSLAMQKQTWVIVAQKVAWAASLVAMKAYAIGAKIAAAAQWLLNVALNANPIGLVVIAIFALVSAGMFLYKNWSWIAPMLGSIFGTLWETTKTIFGNIWSTIKTIASNIWDIFKNLIAFVGNVFTGEWGKAWENVKNIFANVFSSLAAVVKLPINNVIAVVNAAIKGINGALGKLTVPDWVPIFGGKSFSFNIPPIPQLAEGGIATGSTIANIGEGREPEAVLPLSRLDSMLNGGTRKGNESISVNYAPTINVTGGGDVSGDIKRGLENGLNDLERRLEKILANRRRLSFA